MRISDWSSDVCSSDLARTISLAVIARRKSSRLVKGSSNTTILFAIWGSRLSCDRTKARAKVFLSPALIVVSNQGSSALVLVTSTSSEERREGQECVSTCKYRWTQYH